MFTTAVETLPSLRQRRRCPRAPRPPLKPGVGGAHRGPPRHAGRRRVGAHVQAAGDQRRATAPAAYPRRAATPIGAAMALPRLDAGEPGLMVSISLLPLARRRRARRRRAVAELRRGGRRRRQVVARRPRAPLDLLLVAGGAGGGAARGAPQIARAAATERPDRAVLIAQQRRRRAMPSVAQARGGRRSAVRRRSCRCAPSAGGAALRAPRQFLDTRAPSGGRQARWRDRSGVVAEVFGARSTPLTPPALGAAVRRWRRGSAGGGGTSTLSPLLGEGPSALAWSRCDVIARSGDRGGVQHIRRRLEPPIDAREALGGDADGRFAGVQVRHVARRNSASPTSESKTKRGIRRQRIGERRCRRHRFGATWTSHARGAWCRLPACCGRARLLKLWRACEPSANRGARLTHALHSAWARC